MTDEKLDAPAKKGSVKAFEALVVKHQKQLYYTALGILHSGWDALDVCQDTFLKAFSSLDTLKDTAKFKAWLTRILVNKSHDCIRKRIRLIPVEEVFGEDQAGEPDAEKIDLLGALHSLREETRLVITLRYFQDMSIKDIADIAACPEGTVKSRLSNGLKQLRQFYEKEKG